MNIKTFPLQFTEEYLELIKKIAKDSKMTTKEFILNCIKEKVDEFNK